MPLRRAAHQLCHHRSGHGAYTAIVSGVDETTGMALVEAYALQ